MQMIGHHIVFSEFIKIVDMVFERGLMCDELQMADVISDRHRSEMRQQWGATFYKTK